MWVQQGILRSLKEAAFYSILADESADIATIEELSICFRWVDSSGSPVKHFLGLVSLSACGAASIFAALKAFLADSDIDAGKLRGQGYDGAATFSGTKNGVQKFISAHWNHEHCLCTVGHMFFSFAAFQLLDVCQV